MNIALVEQDLPHYRIPIFQELEEILEVELTVFHGGKLTNSDHILLPDEKIPFKQIKLDITELFAGRVYYQDISILFRKKMDFDVAILRGNIRNLSLIPFILYFKLNKTPIILWGQGYSRKRKFKPSENLKDKVYLWLVKFADAYVCYTDEIKDVLSKYVNSQKLFVANNTLDSNKILEHRSNLEKIGKERVKKQLSLTQKNYVSFIGRMKKRKKLDYLLNVYKKVKAKNKNIGLILIGGGTKRKRLERRIKEEDIKDVIFTGPLINFEAAKYLFASDVLVMPGWLGLAVNHGLLLGLPVITQKTNDSLIGHPPEAKHVKPGYNGKLSKLDDINAMANDIEEVIGNSQFYSRNAIEYAENNLTIKKMLQGFKDAIEYVKS